MDFLFHWIHITVLHHLQLVESEDMDQMIWRTNCRLCMDFWLCVWGGGTPNTPALFKIHCTFTFLWLLFKYFFLLLGFSNWIMMLFGMILFCFVFVSCFFRAASVAYGSSQARGRIGAAATSLNHSPSNGGSSCVCDLTYTTAPGNAGSLIHWVRPGIQSASSWILVRFITR